MAIEDRQLIQHLRTSGITAPPANAITDGEIALSMDNTNPKIFFKKNNGEFAEFVDKEYIDNAIEGALYQEITYSDLVTLRNQSGLTLGMVYRITDYTTTTKQSSTRSSGHVFDIIVVADDVDKLNENARAIQHSGDTYFANSNLKAWELKYSLDNDTSKFAWADSGSTGRGVIYWMKDEFNNECPYDFKNIQFKVGANTTAGTVADVFYYTFSVASNAGDITVTDHSFNGSYCYANKMGMYVSSNKQQLSFNVFRNTLNVIKCYSNTFGNDCHNNTFGNDCQYNTFGGSCYGNTFGSGCYDNIFGNSCYSNTFKNTCCYNTFGNYYYSNTFGNNCNGNTFGNNCSYNTFGNYCHYNTLVGGCRYIKFGNSGSTKSYYQYIIVENGNQYIYLDCTGTTSSSNYYQNVKICQGVNNTSTYKTITDGNVGQTYQTEYGASIMESVTWSQLKTKRNNSQLIPGQEYRITDYTTTTKQSSTRSSGHVFDIIVVADDVDKLNENARAIQHSGDTYFANSNLKAWELKYSLDNDTSKFAWADSGSTGRGVIYWMKDEFNNECPYDFKNIQFFKVGANTTAGTKADVFYYTFSLASGTNDATVTDHSFNGSYCYANKMGMYVTSNKQQLPVNVFRNTDNGSICHSNTFGNDCYRNTFGNGCYENTFGDVCYGNTFGNGYYRNTFGNECHNITFGNNCNYNTFGDVCYGNTFGYSCQRNTFGNNCYSNTFGSSCENNTFGTSCSNNTFGNTCRNNIFGNTCYSNTFGNQCSNNTFGNRCYNNTFGNTCYYNTFGNGCNHIKFGNSGSTKSYYQYIIVENGNQYIYLDCSGTTSDSNPYRNVKICQGVNNTTTYKTITDGNVGQIYQTVYQPENTQVISV